MVDYNTALKKAKEIKKGVETEYKIVASTPVYYICKQILKPKSNVESIKISKSEKSTGDYFSRQVYASTYKNMAERLCKYVEKNHQLPNYIKDNHDKRMKVSDYVYMFSNILVEYDKTGKLPDKVNVNSKSFTKPSENKNTVFIAWVKKFNFTPKYLDDVCDYILKHFDYQFYYDDQKSNAEVINSKAGNCTDLLQMLINMAEALGYEWKVIHTQCKQSKVGHVYGLFRKKGINGGNWFVRDIACIADESRYCVWCEVPNGGNKLAENPSWFLANLRR